jgi:hypothetical protein
MESQGTLNIYPFQHLFPFNTGKLMLRTNLKHCCVDTAINNNNNNNNNNK